VDGAVQSNGSALGTWRGTAQYKEQLGGTVDSRRAEEIGSSTRGRDSAFGEAVGEVVFDVPLGSSRAVQDGGHSTSHL
jgi:hypothetical protein